MAKADEAIIKAAEMIFNGATQEEAAKALGVSQGRISHYAQTDLYKETIEKLEIIKKRITAEYAQEQAKLYADEFEGWARQSRQMAQISAATYSKLMTLVNGALDVAVTNPDKIMATGQLRNVPNLIKAAIALQQQIDISLNLRLGVDELSKKFNEDKSDI